MRRPYRERLLGTGERIVYLTHQHRALLWWWSFKWLLLIAIAVAGIALGVFGWTPAPGSEQLRSGLFLAGDLASLIGLGGLGLTYLRWRGAEYVVTNRRVIQIEGILSKHTFDSSLDFINDLHIHQSLLGRIFDYGDVQILTANEDSDEPSQTYTFVERPLDFVRAINDQREARRQPPQPTSWPQKFFIPAREE